MLDVIVSRDVNQDPSFFIFVSTHSYNDRLLVSLHDLKELRFVFPPRLIVISVV